VLVHFDPSGERAFTFEKGEGYEISLQGNSVVKKKIGLNHQSLYRFTSNIETYENITERDVVSKLESYIQSNRAQLLRNALELFNSSPDGSNRILSRLLGSLELVKLDLPQVFAHLVRSKDLLEVFDGKSWKVKNLPAWEPFRAKLAEHYSFSHAKKVAECWSSIQTPIGATEEELFSRCRQKHFFETLNRSCDSSVDLNASYLEYCGIVGNLPRSEGTLEEHFFEAFSKLSPTIAAKKRTYHSLQSSPQFSKVFVSNPALLSDFIAEANALRSSMEESLASLASKISVESLKGANVGEDGEAEKRKLEEILAEWNSLFHFACLGTSRALQNYFQPRHKVGPRITVKSIDLEENSLRIHTIFRDHKADYAQSSQLEQNSGFQFALRTGEPFVCNNIPASFKAGIYRNPRLPDLNNASLRQNSARIKSKHGWASLWSVTSGQTSDSSYKSTMIIPINISRVTKQSGADNRLTHQAVTAFLCIDHEVENYFDPKHDVRILESGVGILRSYLSTRHSVLVSTQIILKLVDRLKDRFRTIRVQSSFESRIIEVSRLKRSIIEADSTSALSFVDYGLRHDVEVEDD